MRANVALEKANIKAVKLGPKRWACNCQWHCYISKGWQSLAMHKARSQAILSQLLTTMTVETLMPPEALDGTDESFDPSFAKICLHSGQRVTYMPFWLDPNNYVSVVIC